MEESLDHLSDRAREDYLLVRRAIDNNDPKAFAAIVEKYEHPLYHLMYKMTSNETDAEDMTIEAFGKAFRNLESYTPSYGFNTWLFRIGTNNCIDFLRRRRNHSFSIDEPVKTEDGDTFYTEIKDGEPNPEFQTIDRERKRILRKMVHSLKPRYRELIEMRYFKEMSYEEMAVALQLPLGTVKAQLFRARELLSRILGDKRDKL
jgi:RNA polymerase sigma-70 factor (ECF subfamily)